MPVTREDHEMWAAARTLAMHLDGPCAQCTPEGCRLYRWAGARLERWEAEHKRRYPSAKRPAAPGAGSTVGDALGKRDA